MNNIREYRSELRNRRRKDELELLKENMRNLIYYQGESQRQECALCQQDSWLTCERIVSVIHLIAAIFTTKHICPFHLESFINKTIQGLQAEPTLLAKIYAYERRESKEIVYRKIFLLVDLLYQHQLSQNQRLVEEIGNLMRSDFMMNLMDCAFEYNCWTIEGNMSENWEVQIKSMCQSFLLSLVERNPSLISQCLEEYPIFSMIQNTKGQKRVEIINSLASHVFDWGKEYESNIKHINSLFQSFKLHLNETKGKTHNLEVFIAIIQLASAFLQYHPDETFAASLLFYIQTNHRLKEQAEEPIRSVLHHLRMVGSIMQSESDHAIDIQ